MAAHEATHLPRLEPIENPFGPKVLPLSPAPSVRIVVERSRCRCDPSLTAADDDDLLTVQLHQLLADLRRSDLVYQTTRARAAGL